MTTSTGRFVAYRHTVAMRITTAGEPTGAAAVSCDATLSAEEEETLKALRLRFT